MAARKRKSSRKSSRKSVKCKVVTVKGRRRKMCWGRNGKLTSNRKA